MPESAKRDEKESKKIAKEMAEHFFASSKASMLCEKLETIKVTLNQEYTSIIDSYIHNITAMDSAASIPFSLAYASACNSEYQKIRTIEAIKALKITESESDLKEHREATAKNQAADNFNEFIDSKEGTESIAIDAANFLLNSISQNNLSAAASELLNQATILLWGAFEVFCRDMFITFLNDNPDEIKSLMEDANAKRRFENKKISIEDLSNYGFNLSKQMGEFLASQQDMSDLKTIKAVYFALFPKETSLHDALNQQDLWVLGQRRHLLIHRCGVIDKKYIDSTNDDVKLGAKLRISPDELEKYIDISFNTSLAILNCVAIK